MAVLKTPSILAEKGICHMTKTTITTLPAPDGFSPDPLTDILRAGARDLIQQAVEAELSALLEFHSGDRTEDGRTRLVRHGHLPEREVITGIGAVPVKVPRVRDRGEGAEKIRFTSTILPPYLRKAKSIEELLPWLYLPGFISKASPQATFKKLWLLCWGRTLRDCLRRRSHGLRRIGGMSMTAGNAAISAHASLSMSGRMGSISAPEWLRKNNAFWC